MSLKHLLTHYLNKKTFITLLKAITISLIVCLLGACGQKGPLYLPAEKKTSSAVSTNLTSATSTITTSTITRMSSAETQNSRQKKHFEDV